ncbi:MAG: family 20 glycosylhydrolase [Armatimonadota bacterium]
MLAKDLILAPVPKEISAIQGVFISEGKRYIKLCCSNPQSLLQAARKTGLRWDITAGPSAPDDQVGLVILLDANTNIPSEGYRLSINTNRIEIAASDSAGAYYGACTLAQILRQSGDQIPCLEIIDSPDLKARGVMIDISRDKVPTMETLYNLVDLLSEWKINQVQLYTEHTFAYPAHPIVWKDATPMTGEQVLDLDAYCKSRYVELVPNQNSFGHMGRWLMHEEYRSMAEAPNGCDTAWGFMEANSLSPVDSRSIPFVKGLFDELLPHFSSQLFNVGCDETIDLGCGRSKEACEERGTGRVYLDFLLDIYNLVKEHGRTMMFWGDIIMHYPELISELPVDCVALEWGYESAHPFADHGAKFRQSGIPFYVCPGTSSWNSLSGRTVNAVENITNAARNGLEQGAVGMLNTDWGDSGHWQPLPVSYTGFLAGAMASWNAKTDLRDVLANCLSLHAFNDTSMKIGQAFYDLGDVYRVFKKQTFNSSIPWMMLFHDKDNEKSVEDLDISEFDEMDRKLDEITSKIDGDNMLTPDASIVREELIHVIDTLRLSALAGRIRLGNGTFDDITDKVDDLKRQHERVWLLRNRPGGLSDSTDRIKVG